MVLKSAQDSGYLAKRKEMKPAEDDQEVLVGAF